jgi:hypothetical protein
MCRTAHTRAISATMVIVTPVVAPPFPIRIAGPVDRRSQSAAGQREAGDGHEREQQPQVIQSGE